MDSLSFILNKEIFASRDEPSPERKTEPETQRSADSFFLNNEFVRPLLPSKPLPDRQETGCEKAEERDSEAQVACAHCEVFS